jgi:hypothetical protein
MALLVLTHHTLVSLYSRMTERMNTIAWWLGGVQSGASFQWSHSPGTLLRTMYSRFGAIMTVDYRTGIQWVTRTYEYQYRSGIH